VSDRGDLVWLEFTPQAGSEQRGRRPSLIPSPKAYNGKVDLTLFCLVTSAIKRYPFEVKLPDGYDVSGVVLSGQLKSLDWRSRKVNLIERASSDVRARRLIKEALGNKVVKRSLRSDLFLMNVLGAD
jgi:mRNA interferase MazF